MDPVEYATWQAGNAKTYGPFRANRPCVDCPADWRGEMTTAGRCNREERAMPVDERFDRLPPDDDPGPAHGAAPAPRPDLLGDVLRGREIDAAEDPVLADPLGHWTVISGADDE